MYRLICKTIILLPIFARYLQYFLIAFIIFTCLGMYIDFIYTYDCMLRQQSIFQKPVGSRTLDQNHPISLANTEDMLLLYVRTYL